MKDNIRYRNAEILNASQKVLVGGVNSPARAFKHLGISPIPIKRGRGANIYDYDGNRYIDYCLSFGAAILGHADPRVVKSVRGAAIGGFAFGATSAKEAELAGLIRKAVPFINKIRFVNSGTEAVMGAVRLARGYTKRDKVLKFKNAYHGHADYLLTDAGSGLTTLKIPASKGVPSSYLKDTLIADYGNRQLIEKIFKEHGKEIAAVIVEPVGGNYGVTPPDVSLLKYLRRITRISGSLLIFDEVITGFRFSYGSSSKILGIRPDIICLGKIIGGGLPIGAFGGDYKIMKHLAPEGKVYQASTFAGNPIVMASGIATLKVLYGFRKRYERLSDLAESICETINGGARAAGVNIEVSIFKSMFSVRFKSAKEFRYFYKKLLSSGIYFAPSEYESNFISFAHTKKDIEKTERALKNIFKNWR